MHAYDVHKALNPYCEIPSLHVGHGVQALGQVYIYIYIYIPEVFLQNCKKNIDPVSGGSEARACQYDHIVKMYHIFSVSPVGGV